MKKSKRTLMILFCLVSVMAASMTLTRCGSGIGGQVDGSANGMKF